MATAVYTGATDAQVQWGGCDDPRGLLTEGSRYVVTKREVHSMHTKLHLAEYPGVTFNSVCFDEK